MFDNRENFPVNVCSTSGSKLQSLHTDFKKLGDAPVEDLQAKLRTYFYYLEQYPATAHAKVEELNVSDEEARYQMALVSLHEFRSGLPEDISKFHLDKTNEFEVACQAAAINPEKTCRCLENFKTFSSEQYRTLGRIMFEANAKDYLEGREKFIEIAGQVFEEEFTEIARFNYPVMKEVLGVGYSTSELRSLFQKALASGAIKNAEKIAADIQGVLDTDLEVHAFYEELSLARDTLPAGIVDMVDADVKSEGMVFRTLSTLEPADRMFLLQLRDEKLSSEMFERTVSAIDLFCVEGKLSETGKQALLAIAESDHTFLSRTSLQQLVEGESTETGKAKTLLANWSELKQKMLMGESLSPAERSEDVYADLTCQVCKPLDKSFPYIRHTLNFLKGELPEKSSDFKFDSRTLPSGRIGKQFHVHSSKEIHTYFVEDALPIVESYGYDAWIANDMKRMILTDPERGKVAGAIFLKPTADSGENTYELHISFDRQEVEECDLDMVALGLTSLLEEVCRENSYTVTYSSYKPVLYLCPSRKLAEAFIRSAKSLETEYLQEKSEAPL